MSLDLGLILLVIVLGFISLGFFIQRILTQKKDSTEDMESLVAKVFGMTATKMAEQSQQILSSERRTIAVDLDNKRQAFEKLITDLRAEMHQKNDELKAFEKDRTQKFGELKSQLDEYRKMSDELRISTQQLAKVLSNNQQRGAWGERIIDDLLTAHGLIEGVHFVKQEYLPGTQFKPDITLLLPDKRFVAVDVKFPYTAIQKMTEAESTSAKAEQVKQFTQDMKAKIKQVAKYILPEANTLDYAVMFVPNEMVFSFINQKFPDLVDEAMQAKVILVSPFTFLMLSRTLRESYRHFMVEDNVRDVVKHLEAFVKEWVKFKEALDKYGRSINTLKVSYEELVGTRVRQLDKKIEKIDEVNGQKLAAPEETITPLLPQK